MFQAMQVRPAFKSSILAIFLSASSLGAQTTARGVSAPPPLLPQIPMVHSPQISPAKVVTFRLYAPKAMEVLLKSEGLDSVPGLPKAEVESSMKGSAMTKGSDGVWTFSLGPLMPGAFRYTLIVDGVSTTDPENSLSSESLTHMSSLFLIPGNVVFDVRDVPHGAVAEVLYHSTTLGEERRMHVYLPPGYDKATGKNYPVLYLLHGGGDSDASWSTVGLANTILDNLIAEHRAVPMIMVMPAGHITREMRPFDPNKMGLDAFNQDFIQDILPYVEGHYRVAASRDSRALAGLSMGGIQTLNIGLTHLPLFSSLGVFSSGWFPPARERFAAEHSSDLDSTEKSGLKLLWVGAGKEDIAHANCLMMLDLLRAHGFKPEYHESEGYHTWSTWQQYLSVYLPRLFQPVD